jgi:hypothetical protein
MTLGTLILALTALQAALVQSTPCTGGHWKTLAPITLYPRQERTFHPFMPSRPPTPNRNF